jgi:hypothetical protein
MQHDANIGLDFLRWMHAEGPWCLTAINPDQQGIRTATFYLSTADELRKWMAKHHDWNNKPTHDLNKKAEREDIGQMCFLHVDVDPRKGEDVESEQQRIQALFQNLPPGIPQPSAVVFSGGGYNALWRLDTPVAIDGELPKAEEYKRYNLQLEIQLGGDNCHNLDRVLRLPGTVNWPNERKRKNGRVACMSTIVYKNANAYPLTTFLSAPPVQNKKESGLAAGGGVQVKVSGNVARLNSVSDLGDAVGMRTRVLIVQGMDPDEPNKWTSRSELLFHVCCELVRAGCTDDTIFSVITDPGFKISASVLDKPNVERYALRQIQRAREDAIDPQLRVLNEKHVVIANTGGRCRVAEEIMDHALNRHRLTFQSFEDFRNRYMHIRVKAGETKDGEPRYMPLGQWWLQHPQRKQLETIVFAPGREVENALNLWKGFGVEARPGNAHQPFLDHILHNVCNGVTLYYNYLIKWMARAVQKPDTPGEVAVVFRGDMGTGKGTVAREFGALWGRHYIQISDPKHLVGSFNAHLRDAVIVFADEAFYAGDKKHESILKTLITEELLVIEGKGRDAETSRNFVHLMMASNSAWVVPAGLNERRYLVLDVAATQMQNTSYFEKVRTAMEGPYTADGPQYEGRKNFLHFLLTMDIRDFDVRAVPKTEALRDQKLLSLSTEHEWLYQKLQEGRWLRDHTNWNAPIFKEDLLDDYLRYAQKIGVQRRATATALGRFLCSVMPPGYPRSRQHTRQYANSDGVRMTERAYAYEFPPLAECRAHWDKNMAGPYPWPDDSDQPNGASQVKAF